MGTRVLLRGGYVHSPADPHATAVCVDGDAVVWTGGDDASDRLVDHVDRVVELHGRLVTPAFVDAHAHLAQNGFALGGLDLSGIGSLAEALDALRGHAAATTAPVVLGHGWDETTWPEGRVPTRAELDRAAPGKVVFLSRVDVHSAVVSTSFLDRCPAVAGADGFDADGRVERDAHHEARLGVFAMIPPSSRREALERALRAAAEAGLGMVHELGAPHICPETDLAVARDLADQLGLPEVVGYWGELGAAEKASALGCAGAAGDLCIDGSLGSRTAALAAPYADADTVGHLYLSADEIADHVVGCTEAGLQAGFHVIGDRAVAEAVEGLERAAEKVGEPALLAARHRLEHVEMITPEQVAVLDRLGVTASVQPVFDAWWGSPGAMYAERLGGQRSAPMNPFGSMSRAGVTLAFGSDCPVTPFDPWAAVRAAAYHHDEGERMTVRGAFGAHTRGGWRAARRDEGGVVAVGAPASLAVWDVPGDLVVETPDPRAGVPHLPDLAPDVDPPTCVMTLVRGRVAYEREGAL